MISFKDVTFRYGEEGPLVLKDINLKILPGESVCVMGANGSGKSTFAKIIAGLLPVKSGHLKVAVESAVENPVGIIFQNPDNQMVATTVEKELAFALENEGYSQEQMEEMITATLKKFEIGHLRKRLTAEMSGGEKQRVALASVIIFKPDILVLDEPDSYLDEQGKTAFYNELEQIKKDKPAMVRIHITQYPETARRYKRLIVFYKGEIAADGNPDEIFDNYDFCIQNGLSFSTRTRGKINIPAYNGNEIDKYKSKKIHKICFEKVNYSYGADRPVLSDLNCEFNGGEITGVTGYSGTGKSTLGNLFCRLLKPTGGKIICRDMEGDDMAVDKLRGKISGVFQLPERQFFLPTCRDEVKFGPDNIGKHLDSNDLKEFLAMAGLNPDSFLIRDPFTLSGGEKRRLAFSVVLSMMPDFVVFDEPTCGLDPEGVGRFILLAKALKDKGMGLVVISHDGNVIKRLADRILVLRKEHTPRMVSNEEYFTSEIYREMISPVNNSLDI